MRRLLPCQLPINRRWPTCCTPTALALQVAAIEALISLGCEVVVQDAVGSTPLHVAAGEGHLDAIGALVRLGCSSQGGRRRRHAVL